MEEFVIFLSPGRDEMPVSPTEEEARLVGEHFAHLQRALEEGVLVMAGRTTEAPFVGIAVLRAANREAAEAFMKNDPGISAGVFKATLQPYSIALLQK